MVPIPTEVEDDGSGSFTAPAPVSGQGLSLNSGLLSDDANKKIRKPYTITKSRESWTEQEHDKFLESLQLYVHFYLNIYLSFFRCLISNLEFLWLILSRSNSIMLLSNWGLLFLFQALPIYFHFHCLLCLSKSETSDGFFIFYFAQFFNHNFMFVCFSDSTVIGKKLKLLLAPKLSSRFFVFPNFL